jgi:hypothetical protein
MRIQLHNCNRSGNVAIIVSICLAMLVGFAAIAIDGGLIQHNRRSTQASADAAALAAANELYRNYPAQSGLDTSGTAAAKARALAAVNGFPDDGVNNKVTVLIPPTSGNHIGKAGYAEVIIEHYQDAAFSRIWSKKNIVVSSRAVAMGAWVPFRNGILVLNPTEPNSLNNNGGGYIKILNADIIVNSNAPDGAIATGGGVIAASDFWLSGDPGWSTSGSGTFQGTIHSKEPPTPDPLAYLDPPDKAALTVQSNNNKHIGGNGNKTVTLSPGIYRGGISVTGQANVVMLPGIYYMEGGGFSFTGQGSLNATGVMLYTDPTSNSDNINVNGLGAVTWTPPTSGPYKGIALWQRRDSTNTVSMGGNGLSSISGTFYAKKGLLAVSGNGGQDVLGSQYISDKLNLGGNGNFNVDWKVDQTARTRIVRLVE